MTTSRARTVLAVETVAVGAFCLVVVLVKTANGGADASTRAALGGVLIEIYGPILAQVAAFYGARHLTPQGDSGQIPGDVIFVPLMLASLWILAPLGALLLMGRQFLPAEQVAPSLQSLAKYGTTLTAGAVAFLQGGPN